MIKEIILTFFIIFALIGALFSSTILHEMSHYRDFEELDLEDEEICILSFPANESSINKFLDIRGYYYFTFSGQEERESIKRIDKFTEFKAYSLSIGILIIFLIGLYFFIIYFIEDYFKRKQWGEYHR